MNKNQILKIRLIFVLITITIMLLTLIITSLTEIAIPDSIKIIGTFLLLVSAIIVLLMSILLEFGYSEN